MRHGWLELGFNGRALTYLTGQNGWFFTGHRAQNDILAQINLLGHEASAAFTTLARLITASERPSYKAKVIDLLFEGKHALKAHGCRWHPALHFWSKSIAANAVEAEQIWLLADVYTGYRDPSFYLQRKCDRFRH